VDAQFRAEESTFLDDAVIDRVINQDRPLELAPQQGVFYWAFVDPHGGGADRYTLAIGHREGDKFVCDLIRGMRGDPRAVTENYAALCKSYRITKVHGDNYSKDWCQLTWRDFGFPYEVSKKPASKLYLESQPHWTRGKLDIPNHTLLINELRLLEITPGHGGDDKVTHPRNCNDDHANALCGCIATTMNTLRPMLVTSEHVAQAAAATGRRVVAGQYGWRPGFA
jgi:hypothetical protein